MEAVKDRSLAIEIPAAARLKGFREDALPDILARARRAFNLNANGDLRGPNGLTPTGWCSFILPTEMPEALIGETGADNSSDAGPRATLDHRETARERLGRANGDLPVAGFQ